MSTRTIGFGIVVSTDDAAQARVAKKVPRKRALPWNFFSAHEMSPPSPLFEAMAGTFYFAKDVDGRFVWGNRLLQESRRLAHANDVIGRRDHDFLLRAIADRVRADDLAVMSGATTIDNKLEIIAGDDGMPCWVSTTKKPLRDKHGDVIGVEGISRNVRDVDEIAPAYEVFKPAIRHLQACAGQGVDVRHLAGLSNMSPATFEREFKRHFALTSRQYRRMQNAALAAASN